MSSSDDMIDTNEMNTCTIQFHKSEEKEPPPKRFNLVCDLLEQEKIVQAQLAPLLDGDKEIEKYLDRHSAEEKTLDPLHYWIQKDLYLVLFPVTLLCIH